MKQQILVAAVLVCLAGVCVGANAQTSANGATKNSKPKPARGSQGSATGGEKRFQTNCGRCHNAPEDVSPREARAVARHMRVRAMLSAEDEKLILEFLAP
jgi:cytochrome c5